jgi:hypothetical protein
MELQNSLRICIPTYIQKHSIFVWLWSEEIYFVQIAQKRSRQQQNRHFHLTIEDGFDWPKYLARNIAVTNKLMGTGYIARVSVNGQDMCCKIGTTTWGAAIQREYECLQEDRDV